MAKPSPNDLNYGHFGQATFNVENGEWNFSRNLGQRNELVPLGSWKSVLTPAIRFENSPAPEHAHSIRNTQKAARELAHGNPELAPALHLLPELAIASAAVTSITSTYDPAVGPLLSIGSFTPRGHYHHPRRIAALPAGECGNILRLVPLMREKHGWGKVRSSWVEGPSIMSEESGYWIEDAAPVQQVCWAQGDDRSAFLAVRYPIRTVLFRPTYKAMQIAPKNSQYYKLPYSNVDLPPLLDITVEQTGGVAHADVTFNPDYQRQLGLVDQKGNWSVWDIEGGKRESQSYAASCAAQGNITMGEFVQIDEPEDGVVPAREDGWARILWVGDVNTILVCNRRTAAVFDIRAKEFASLTFAELIPKRSADWILDVKRHPKNKHQFFVLTSSRLFLLAVTGLNDVSKDNGRVTGTPILLSWTHFQGSDDITLQLSIPTTSDEDSIVLMHSRLKHLVMVFRFRDSDSNDQLPFSSSDPALLKFDSTFLESVDHSRCITHFHLEQLRFKEIDRQHRHKAGLGQSYAQNDVHFFQLSAQLSDLSVHQLILYSHEHDSSSTGHNRLLVQPFDWSTIVYLRSDFYSDFPPEMDDDNFVVPDIIEAKGPPKLKKPYQVPKLLAPQSPALQKVDFSSIYSALTQKEVVPKPGDEFTAFIDKISNLFIEGGNAEDAPRETLLEIAASSFKVLDVDHASLKLQDLLLPKDHDGPRELRLIASARALNLPDSKDQGTTISSIYDTILQSWIAPLPKDIPARIRQTKEQLARHIAMEVMLASTRIRRSEPIESTKLPTASEAGPSQDSSIFLPILPTIEEQEEPSSLPSLPVSDPMLISSQPAFLSSATSQPAFPSSSLPQPPFPIPESTSSPPTLSQHIPNPIARLRQHLSINKPAVEIPKGISSILAHWNPGSDPRAYDWHATTHSLYQHPEQQDPASSPSSSAHQSQSQREKKAERLAKRQKREDDLSNGTGKAEAQPLPGVVRSSPGPMFGGAGLGGSSQTQSGIRSQGMGIGVQSQVEPGRHGGRPKPKKKGKGRVSGF